MEICLGVVSLDKWGGGGRGTGGTNHPVQVSILLEKMSVHDCRRGEYRLSPEYGRDFKRFGVMTRA